MPVEKPRTGLDKKLQGYRELLAFLSLLALLTLFFRFTDLDLDLERLFFVEGKGWVYADLPLWSLLYHFGNYPAIVLAAGSLLALLASCWVPRLLPFRWKALFMILVMLLGPGLVVNLILKDHWGRPRPREVRIFSGSEPYHPVWEKGVSGKGRSFPSGHASMGFYLLTPYFIFRRSSDTRAWLFLGLGLSYGTLMGLARMIQGGHFASDVIWSGGIIYLCGMSLAYALPLDD